MTSLPVQKSFPLLTLPPEVRRCIWTYLVVKDGHLIFRDYTQLRTVEIEFAGLQFGEPSKRRRKDAGPRSVLAVAFTCRQLYLEVTPIYCGHNTFCPSYIEYWFRCYETCQRFTDAIGPKNASTITDLNLYDPSCTPVAQCLKLLPNVKRLHFKKRGGSQVLKDMTSRAKRHKSVTMFYGGEVWGPDKWSLYPVAN